MRALNPETLAWLHLFDRSDRPASACVRLYNPFPCWHLSKQRKGSACVSVLHILTYLSDGLSIDWSCGPGNDRTHAHVSCRCQLSIRASCSGHSRRHRWQQLQSTKPCHRWLIPAPLLHDQEGSRLCMREHVHARAGVCVWCMCVCGGGGGVSLSERPCKPRSFQKSRSKTALPLFGQQMHLSRGRLFFVLYGSP